jgi:hypothetical protein
LPFAVTCVAKMVTKNAKYALSTQRDSSDTQ